MKQFEQLPVKMINEDPATSELSVAQSSEGRDMHIVDEGKSFQPTRRHTVNCITLTSRPGVLNTALMTI